MVHKTKVVKLTMLDALHDELPESIKSLLAQYPPDALVFVPLRELDEGRLRVDWFLKADEAIARRMRKMAMSEWQLIERQDGKLGLNLTIHVLGEGLVHTTQAVIDPHDIAHVRAMKLLAGQDSALFHVVTNDLQYVTEFELPVLNAVKTVLPRYLDR